MLRYKTKKGLKDLKVSQHALERFAKRFWMFYTHRESECKHACITQENMQRINNGQVYEVLEEIFAKANKIPKTSFNAKEKKRCKKYGDTIRYRCRPFDFIIQDGCLVTIELVTGQRNLNVTY
jgi:hypothetical protein